MKKRGLWGVINRSGKEIIPCNYYSISHLTNNILEVSIHNNFESNHNNDKYGLFKISGEKICDCIYDNISEKNGRFIARQGKISFLFNDRWRVLAQYDNYSPNFTENDNILKYFSGRVGKDWFYGLCSLDGTSLLQPKYEDFIISNNIILAKGKNFVDYYSLTGQKINNIGLKDGFKFISNQAVVQQFNGDWYKMDINGNFYKIIFKDIIFVFDNNNILIRFEENEGPRYCLANINGEIIKKYFKLKGIINPKIQEWEKFIGIEVNENPREYFSNPKTFFFNKSNGVNFYSCENFNSSVNLRLYGSIMIVPYFYDSEKLSWTNYMKTRDERISEHWVYRLINFDNGKEIGLKIDENRFKTHKEFDYIFELEDNTFKIQDNYKYGFITPNADYISRAIYDSAKNFHYSYAVVSHKGNHYIINKENKIITNSYSDILSYQKNF